MRPGDIRWSCHRRESVFGRGTGQDRPVRAVVSAARLRPRERWGRKGSVQEPAAASPDPAFGDRVHSGSLDVTEHGLAWGWPPCSAAISQSLKARPGAPPKPETPTPSRPRAAAGEPAGPPELAEARMAADQMRDGGPVRSPAMSPATRHNHRQDRPGLARPTGSSGRADRVQRECACPRDPLRRRYIQRQAGGLGWRDGRG